MAKFEGGGCLFPDESDSSPLRLMLRDAEEGGARYWRELADAVRRHAELDEQRRKARRLAMHREYARRQRARRRRRSCRRRSTWRT